MSKGRHRKITTFCTFLLAREKLQNIHMKKLIQCLQDKIQLLIICGISISAINRLCVFLFNILKYKEFLGGRGNAPINLMSEQ